MKYNALYKQETYKDCTLSFYSPSGTMASQIVVDFVNRDPETHKKNCYFLMMFRPAFQLLDNGHVHLSGFTPTDYDRLYPRISPENYQYFSFEQIELWPDSSHVNDLKVSLEHKGNIYEDSIFIFNNHNHQNYTLRFNLKHTDESRTIRDNETVVFRSNIGMDYEGRMIIDGFSPALDAGHLKSDLPASYQFFTYETYRLWPGSYRKEEMIIH